MTITRTTTGTVKWFDEKKGYGFIEHPEGDVFVHYSEIQEEGYRTLDNGQVVEYVLARGEKGLTAREVRKLPKPEDTDGN